MNIQRASIDGGMVTTIAASAFGHLPEIMSTLAATVAVVYYCVLMYQMWNKKG